MEIAAYKRQYHQTPTYKKSNTIRRWKRTGIIHDDFDALYSHYMSTTNCEDCGRAFSGSYGDGSGAYRCLATSYNAGMVLCSRCNLCK